MLMSISQGKHMADENLIALADSFMAIFGYKRLATVKDNVITPAKFEKKEDDSETTE
jgi:hypothetical protein